MTSCNRPGCGGAIDEAGYCRRCLEPYTGKPAVGMSEPPASGPAAGPAVHPPATGRTTDAAWWAGALIHLPVIPPVDPMAAVQLNPTVSADQRICRACSQPTRVGQSHHGQEALLTGVCHRCGTPYSFAPRLAPGAMVDDRYRIVGCIGHGGVGWVFLAEDTHLQEQHVVLKSLIDPGNPDAAGAAKRELKFLTEVTHENVVRVRDFVSQSTDVGKRDDYIVMDYVNGPTIEDVAGRADGYCAEHVLAYGLQMLAALDHLHGRGWLHCDITPRNLMVAGTRVVVIDLGAGCRVGATEHTWGTRGYRAPEAAEKYHARTVPSDLYSAGMTLRAMFRWTPEFAAARGGPGRSGRGAAGQSSPAVESLEDLVRRATAQDPADRFQTAAEMASQLSGVLRDFVALRTGRPSAAPVSRFGPETGLPDDTLGTIPQLAWWITEDAFRAASDGSGRPLPGLLPPSAIAAGLLPPLRPDPEDPAAELVLSLSGTDPVAAIEQAAGHDSPEASLLRCRAELTREDAGAARGAWTQARDQCGDTDLRIKWHKALVDLAAGNQQEAFAGFSAVRRALPGEVVPKLGLGLCAEYLDDFREAERWYGMAWQADRSHVSAAFGLARTRMRLGDRAAAVTAVDQVPDTSRYARRARIAAFRVLTGSTGAPDSPAAEELDAAEKRLSESPPADDDLGEARDRLRAVLLDARLWHACAQHRGRPAAAVVRLRGELEHCYRGLARHADSNDQHTILIDLANQVRTRTLDLEFRERARETL